MTNLSATIDAYAAIKLEIDSLEKTRKAMKAALDELAPGTYEGERYALTVAATSTDRLDMDAVREKLSPQFIRAHTTTTEGTRLTVKPLATQKVA
jgi:hypothetical protein